MEFQDLYDSYAPDVYRFSLWLSGDRADAEDVMSETFVRAWARRDTIRTRTLKAYLFTIARNVYLEQQRKYRRHVELEDTHETRLSRPRQDDRIQTRIEQSGRGPSRDA